MAQRGPDNLRETENIIAWLRQPVEERPDLTPKQRELFDRWDLADNILREHLSERTALPLYRDAVERKFGAPISERTARRDFDCARRIWGTRPKQDKEYLSGVLLDMTLEAIVKARRLEKLDWMEKLIKRAQELAGLGRQDLDLPALEDLMRPVAIQPVYAPQLLGVEPMSPEERQRIAEQLIAHKREKGFLASAVDVEPEPPDA